MTTTTLPFVSSLNVPQCIFRPMALGAVAWAVLAFAYLVAGAYLAVVDPAHCSLTFLGDGAMFLWTLAAFGMYMRHCIATDAKQSQPGRLAL